MQKWVVICWAVLAVVGADVCPDGGLCKEGETCCNSPANGYGCCRYENAECCDDHIHCCPAGTVCNKASSGCINTTLTIPWVKRTPADQPKLSKSFRMVKAYESQEDDTICPDLSRCPAEYSCLKGVTKFGCCPLTRGISCPDGKHCCPEGHDCSANCRACVKKEFVVTVLCSDGVSECPDGTSCCETTEGKWSCCPLPKAVCCADKIHCCSEGTTCDVENSKCIDSSTKKEMPMWAKLPARVRAAWENQKAEAVNNTGTENAPKVTTANLLPPSGNNVSCDNTTSCPDGNTCCKTKDGSWGCCPLPEAVCCDDHQSCCPSGTTCDTATGSCNGPSGSTPMLKKLSAFLTGGRPAEEKKKEKEGNNVPCDDTKSCPDGNTCCRTKDGSWGCCPLPEAVCCDDHQSCCPSGTTCDTATGTCNGPSGSTPMLKKLPAFLTGAPTTVQPTTESPTTSSKPEEEEKEGEGRINCDANTSCPQSTTCCYMKKLEKWGCCPLPEAVCCEDGSHCCPDQYKCDNSGMSCIKGEVVIPWYTKIPAITSDEAEPYSVQCEGANRCPEQTTCCKLFTGEWGCCPLKNAVCCPDKEHCCPQGYTCDVLSRSCQKLIMMQLERVPLTPVYLLEPQPNLSPTTHKDIKCDDKTSCGDDETCCRTSATSWGCCPSPNAVCCSDMKHCCPTGYTCTEEGTCNSKLYWPNWHMFLANKKRALIV